VQAEGRLQRLEADYQRAARLLGKGISQEEFDRSPATGRGRRRRHHRQSQPRHRHLNLGYTKVKAPLSGRISRRFIDPGNMVKADITSDCHRLP